MPDPADQLVTSNNAKSGGMSIAHALAGQEKETAVSQAARPAVPFLLTDEPSQKEETEQPLSEEGKAAREELLLFTSAVEHGKEKILSAGAAAPKAQTLSPEQLEEFLDGLRAVAHGNDEGTIIALLHLIESSHQEASPVKQLTTQFRQSRQPEPVSNGEVIQRMTIKELLEALQLYSPAIFIAIILIVLASVYFRRQQAAAAPRARRQAPPVNNPRGGAARGAVVPAAPRAVAHPAVVPVAAPVAMAHATVTYNVRDSIELDDADTARAALQHENAANLAAYRAAKQKTDTYDDALRRYNFGRDQNWVPTGAYPNQMQISSLVPQGAYQNFQHYFPNGPAYTEDHINPAIGVAGVIRKITPNPFVGNIAYWIGSGFTHGTPPNWMKAWDNVQQRWLDWNHVNHTSANVPGHVANPPGNAPSHAERQLAVNGYTFKDIQIAGFQLIVTGQRRTS